MKFICLIILFLGMSFSLKAQKNSESTDLEKFREKLETYLEKHENLNPSGDESPMVQKPDTGRYKMPTGNITSYMEDPETGLMKEYKTGNIYDRNSRFMYDSERGMIYDPEKEKFYDFRSDDKKKT